MKSAGRGGVPMQGGNAGKLYQLSVEQLVERLASAEPAPGGGSAAALCAALASALVRMVASLTVGREKYRESWEALEPLMGEAQRLAARLLELVEEDAAAYLGVAGALKLPRASSGEKETRRTAVQAELKKATLVPMETLKIVAKVMSMAEQVCRLGNSNARSDAGAAVQLARAAAVIASYNVRINLSGITDEEFVSRCGREERRALDRAKISFEAAQDALAEFFGERIW